MTNVTLLGGSRFSLFFGAQRLDHRCKAVGDAALFLCNKRDAFVSGYEEATIDWSPVSTGKPCIFAESVEKLNSLQKARLNVRKNTSDTAAPCFPNQYIDHGELGCVARACGAGAEPLS